MRKAQIVRWGKSLAVRIPKGVAERGVVGTDGTDPNFSAAKLGERPVWSPYFGPHISPVVLGRMLDESVPQLNAHNDRKYTSDFAPCHDIQKLSKLTNKMIALSKKALKGKVWETFRGKAFQGNVVLNFTRFPKGEFAAYGRSTMKPPIV